MLLIRLLGELEVTVGGTPVPAPASRRAWALLAWLALHPGEHPRAELAARFWPDVLDSSARASLRSAVWALRRALGPDAAGARGHARARRPALRRGGRSTASASRRSSTVGRLEEAVALDRGPLLHGLDEDWVLEARDEHARRLDDVLAQLAAPRARARRRRRGGDAGRGAARRSTARRGGRARPHGGAVAAAGDRAEALAVHDRLVERLRRELGLAPSRPRPARWRRGSRAGPEAADGRRVRRVGPDAVALHRPRGRARRAAAPGGRRAAWPRRARRPHRRGRHRQVPPGRGGSPTRWPPRARVVGYRRRLRARRRRAAGAVERAAARARAAARPAGRRAGVASPSSRGSSRRCRRGWARRGEPGPPPPRPSSRARGSSRPPSTLVEHAAADRAARARLRRRPCRRRAEPRARRLRRAARRPAWSALLTLVTRRPFPRTRRGRRAARRAPPAAASSVLELELRPLGTRGHRRGSCARRPALDDRSTARVVALADGNPLLAIESARAAAGGGGDGAADPAHARASARPGRLADAGPPRRRARRGRRSRPRATEVEALAAAEAVAAALDVRAARRPRRPLRLPPRAAARRPSPTTSPEPRRPRCTADARGRATERPAAERARHLRLAGRDDLAVGRARRGGPRRVGASARSTRPPGFLREALELRPARRRDPALELAETRGLARAARRRRRGVRRRRWRARPRRRAGAAPTRGSARARGSAARCATRSPAARRRGAGSTRSSASAEPPASAPSAIAAAARGRRRSPGDVDEAERLLDSSRRWTAIRDDRLLRRHRAARGQVRACAAAPGRGRRRFVPPAMRARRWRRPASASAWANGACARGGHRQASSGRCASPTAACAEARGIRAARAPDALARAACWPARPLDEAAARGRAAERERAARALGDTGAHRAGRPRRGLLARARRRPRAAAAAAGRPRWRPGRP